MFDCNGLDLEEKSDCKHLLHLFGPCVENRYVVARWLGYLDCALWVESGHSCALKACWSKSQQDTITNVCQTFLAAADT